jgi:hypothetical protein
MTENTTLVDRWLTRLKNNPFIAVIILAGICISALSVFWDSLPRDWRDWLSSHIPGQERNSLPSTPESGWVFAGYVDKGNELQWASEPRLRLMKPSGGNDRPHIFRVGDIVRPLKSIPQVIADYRTHGTQNQLIPPWRIVEEIQKSEDFTGRHYGPDADLEVMDVTVSQLPDHDFAVWLRVSPTN